MTHGVVVCSGATLKNIGRVAQNSRGNSGKLQNCRGLLVGFDGYPDFELLRCRFSSDLEGNDGALLLGSILGHYQWRLALSTTH